MEYEYEVTLYTLERVDFLIPIIGRMFSRPFRTNEKHLWTILLEVFVPT